MLKEMVFANIEYLFLLILLIPYVVWYIFKRKKTEPTIQVSTTRMYAQAPGSWKIYLLHAPFVLRIISSDQYETLTQQQQDIFGDTIGKKTYKSMTW